MLNRLLFLSNRAFDRYDRDQDGFITKQDLRLTFESQGKTVSDKELVEWVRKRDSHGTGAVDFDDFAKHYI